MTRLLVFRGDQFEQEIELGFATLRIGRSEDNDVILEDPTKAVSRIHAELRYSNGRYEVLDLDSQNGTWVNGSRVERVALQSTTAISIGPYRLMVEESSDALNAARPATQAVPRVVTEEADAPRDDDTSSRRQPGWLEAHRKQLALGAATVAVAAAVGLTRLWTTQQSPSEPEILAAHLSQAKALIEQSEPERAIVEHLDPALAIDPANEEALNLKSTAEALAARRATPPRDPSPGGAPPDNPPPSAPPPPTDATAEPAAASRGARDAFVRLPPENGGLERRPGESVASVRARERAIRQSYDEAKRALQADDFATAERTFTNIQGTAGPRYLDILQMLNEVRRRRVDASSRLMTQAADDEANGRYDAAIEKLRRAHEIDPTAAVDGEIARIAKDKLDTALSKLKEADSKWKMRTVRDDSEALRLYREALRLLPSDHPRIEEVRKRITDLEK